MTAPAPTPPLGLPWRVFHSPGENFFEVHDNAGLEVATFYYGPLGVALCDPDPADRAKAEQRAAFICRAVNAHAQLVEALGNLLCANGHTLDCRYLVDWAPCDSWACQQARAALWAAGGRAGER